MQLHKGGFHDNTRRTMNARFYLLCAVVTFVTALSFFCWLEDRGYLYTKPPFRFTASFIIGALWVILVPALFLEYLLWQVCLFVDTLPWDRMSGWFGKWFGNPKGKEDGDDKE